jgi:hypothetical protein
VTNSPETAASGAGFTAGENSGIEPPEEPPASGQKVREVATIALRAFDTALRVLSKVSSAFPPLQAPVEGLIACIDVFKVISLVSFFLNNINGHIQAASNNKESLEELANNIAQKTSIIQAATASNQPEIKARMQKLAEYVCFL